MVASKNQIAITKKLLADRFLSAAYRSAILRIKVSQKPAFHYDTDREMFAAQKFVFGNRETGMAGRSAHDKRILNNRMADSLTGLAPDQDWGRRQRPRLGEKVGNIPELCCEVRVWSRHSKRGKTGRSQFFGSWRLYADRFLNHTDLIIVSCETFLLFPDRTRFRNHKVVTSVFDRVNIIDGFAVLACQRLGFAGLFEQRGVNLEVFWFHALANALQCGDQNRLAFLLGFCHGKIRRWLCKRRGQRLNPLTIAELLDRCDQHLFAVPAAFSFDPVANNAPKP